MNEQLIEQQSEEVLMVEVSDEVLEAASGNGLAGMAIGAGADCMVPTFGPQSSVPRC